jgi:zinc protease
MKTPKTTIYIKLHGDNIEFNAENRIYFDVVAKLLDKRYLEEVREKEGGSYGVRVSAAVSHYPKQEYALTISFDTDPAKAEKLKGIVYDEIDKLYTDGVRQSDLDEAKMNLLKVRQENLRKNGYWMNSIMHYYNHNEVIVVPAAFEDIVDSITKEKVEEFVRKYLSKPGKIEVVMTPTE